MNLPTLYRGSVKDVLGPVEWQGQSAAVFDYSDAYSVFDWGRMPDLLPKKGLALATLAAHWFEELAQPSLWKEFSRSPGALALRKASRFGAAFNEAGEILQAQGLRSHYLGCLADGQESVLAEPLSEQAGPVRRLLVQKVEVVKPLLTSVLGKQLPDYQATRSAPEPRLIPLEVVFRFSCPQGSSFPERFARDPGVPVCAGLPPWESASFDHARFDFPVLELFTKLEATDRAISGAEGLAISGLSARELEQLLYLTAWVASWLKWRCAAAGLELADGKLEWALGPGRELLLVDAIGPDELRLLVDGVSLSKEFLRTHYRGSPWYGALAPAKLKARSQGTADWKRLVGLQPPALPPEQRELASQLYLTLAHELTGHRFFSEAWGLQRLVKALKESAHA